MYVAIDLETTGLNPQQDAIIEIGAVRFTCAPATAPGIRVLDRFVTFVNPGRAIPLRVQQLTGITDAEVAMAPLLAHVAPDLLAFVGADVRFTVAHNAGFDDGFLRASGIDFHRPMQDTFELATILLPGAASYSLGELAHMLDIPLPDAHRALDDAEATARLFGLLLHLAARLPDGIKRILLAAGRDSGWDSLYIFADQESQRAARPSHTPYESGMPVATRRRANQEAPDPASAIVQKEGICAQPDSSDLTPFYAPGGCLNEVLGPAYEFRAGQASMSQQVMTALAGGDHLLVEAGTGTGKTLAYLLPAALYCVCQGQRTVIATNTIALQDQILDKDIPLIQSLLDRARIDAPRATLLKGRSNYLCTRRLHHWYRNRTLNPAELCLLARTLVWLQVTRSGDVSELFLPSDVDKALWRYVCSDAASCSPQRCSDPCSEDQSVLGTHYRDFFHLARRQAEDAHLIVVNHSLLLTDLESGGRILPPYENVVIDEAHRFEEAATDVLTFRAEWKQLVRWLRDLQPVGELCRQVAGACVHADDFDGQAQMSEIASLSQAAESLVRDFADSCFTLVSNHDELRTETGYTQRVALDRAFRSQPAWSELEIDWDRVSVALSQIVDRLRTLANNLANRQWWSSEPNASYLAELFALADLIDQTTATLNQIMFGTGEVQSGRLVPWAEVDDRQNTATLVCAPAFVSERLENELIHGKRSVILTGATLRTGSGFGFIRDRLGLWDVRAASVDSPFDYKRSTLLFMPSDMPDPRSPHYQLAVERAIVNAAIATGGSTVALFTSYAQLRTTAEAIRGPLDQTGITVLQHGFGSRRRLLREYRQTERAVLLGTRSFWEGIDLPGDELLCLLIVRLPFAVPSDPLVAARSADLENPFRDYTLPDAILRFRQGFGRLIRRSTDRGAVVILDSRVWRKDYGTAFLESLPPCTEKRAPLDTLQDEVRAWLRAGAGAR